MTDRLHRDMIEATRLTRAGRLGEATAFLQRVLRGTPAPDSAHPSVRRAPRMIDAAPETIEPARPSLRTEKPTPGVLRRFFERLKRPDKQTPSPEPGIVPDGGQFIQDSYSNQAGRRVYKLYVPSRYRGQALPLVVMLHGCTQSPDDFAAGTRMNVLAEEHSCLVAYPAQAKSANPSRCWNWFRSDNQQRDRGEPSLIAGITRQIMRTYAVDPHRVYVAGLSAGAAAAVIMGATYPDLYAAIGVHSGLASGAASNLPGALAAMQRGDLPAARRSGPAVQAADGRLSIPTIVFHGDRDTTVHPRNGDLVIAQSRATMTPTPQTEVQRGQVPGGYAYSRTLHADASGRVLFEQWIVHGAGHAWSGGSPAGSYTDPRGPDAAREMLRFFLAHRLPGWLRFS